MEGLLLHPLGPIIMKIYSTQIIVSMATNNTFLSSVWWFVYSYHDDSHASEKLHFTVVYT